MSFAEDVKNELCAYEPETDTDVAMKIEASCLLRMGGSLLLGMKGAIGIRLATANNAVARRLLGILKKTIRIADPCYGTARFEFAEKEYVYIDGGSISRRASSLRGFSVVACYRAVTAKVVTLNGGATCFFARCFFRWRIR